MWAAKPIPDEILKESLQKAQQALSIRRAVGGGGWT